MPAPRHLGSLQRSRNSNAERSIRAVFRERDPVLTVAAALMIVSGIAELLISVRHSFFSIRTGHTPMATYLGAGTGVLYFLAGTLILAMKKSVAALALCLLAVVILSHIAMVMADLYPTDSVSQLFAITLATSTACASFVVVVLKWDDFA